MEFNLNALLDEDLLSSHRSASMMMGPSWYLQDWWHFEGQIQFPERERNEFISSSRVCLDSQFSPCAPRSALFSEKLAAGIFSPFKEILQATDLDQWLPSRQLYQITIAQHLHIKDFTNLSKVAYKRKVVVFLSGLSHAESSLICF